MYSGITSGRVLNGKLLHTKILEFFFKIDNSKVAFMSPFAIEDSHTGLMRQFEVFAIITQPIALMSVAACLASVSLCLFT